MAAESFRIMCHGRLLETMDRAQAYREAHKGAIMLHQGETYVVNEMDLETHTVRVTETDVDYYTQPLKEVDLRVIETLETRDVNGYKMCVWRCRSDRAVHRLQDQERRHDHRCRTALPPAAHLPDKSILACPFGPGRYRRLRSGLDLAGGLHGAEHALIALMPLHVMCDRWDIGGLSTPAFGENGEPTIFVYDGYEGGIGLAEKAFGLLPTLF